MLDHCFFAEGSSGAEARDREGVFQRTTGGNDFGEQMHDYLVGQRSRIVLRQTPQHLCLTLRAVNRTVIFELADGMRRRRALAYQLEDLEIQDIDACAQLFEVV